ncbi:hypothetical protein [Fodinicola feengrottensis]|uniref:hypothetical protein n=1 Tax=Fodinicola feengrottensis TaxID=435914 RepID=UPI0031D9AF10
MTVRDARAFLRLVPSTGRRYYPHSEPDRDTRFALAVFDVDDNQPFTRTTQAHTGQWEARPIAATIAGQPSTGQRLCDAVTLELVDTYIGDNYHAAQMLYAAARRAAFALGYQRVLTRAGQYTALRAARWQWQRVPTINDAGSSYAYVAPGPAPAPLVASIIDQYRWPRWWRLPHMDSVITDPPDQDLQIPQWADAALVSGTPATGSTVAGRAPAVRG